MRYPETSQAIVNLIRTRPDRIGLLCADTVVRIDEPDALAGWLATGICHKDTSSEGFIAIIDRLRHRIPTSASDVFVHRWARKMSTMLATGMMRRSGLAEAFLTQLVRDLLDNRITAERLRRAAKPTAWMLGFLARLLRDVALSKSYRRWQAAGQNHALAGLYLRPQPAQSGVPNAASSGKIAESDT